MLGLVQNGILKICQDHIDQFQKAIALMQAGKMGTGEVRDGLRVDTTAETIAWYSALILDLENTIANIRADRSI